MILAYSNKAIYWKLCSYGAQAKNC